MPVVRYSKKADADLEDISFFTVERWGFDQAEKYIRGLYEICLLISQNPNMGRPCGSIHPKWRRLEHESHVVLYSASHSVITVQRIVHKQRLLGRAIR